MVHQEKRVYQVCGFVCLHVLVILRAWHMQHNIFLMTGFHHVDEAAVIDVIVRWRVFVQIVIVIIGLSRCFYMFSVQF